MCRRIAIRRLLLAVLLCSHLGCAIFEPERSDVIRVNTAEHSHLARKANVEGLHWLDTGDLGLAKHAFSKAIKRDPTFAPAHNNLGQMLYDAGDMGRAAAAFDTALQHNPNNPVPHNNLGLALEHGGKPEEAITHYQTAYELDPKNPEFLGNLVRVRMKLDPWDESVVGQLKELQFIETRPEWREWVETQLAINHNPMLDRGPADPDLSDLDDTLNDGGAEERPNSVIEDVTVDDSETAESPAMTTLPELTPLPATPLPATPRPATPMPAAEPTPSFAPRSSPQPVAPANDADWSLPMPTSPPAPSGPLGR